MIDLHCHLLPGIDDGPATVSESLALARLAVANGITHAVVTPHIHPGRYDNTAVGIDAACLRFEQQLADTGISLQLGYAAEVRLCAEVMTMIAEDAIPFFGRQEDGMQVMLLEFPHSHILPGSDKLVRWLLEQKIRPMIAHPERNKEVMRKPDSLRPFLEMDCLIQLTAGSVAGAFGVLAQSVAVSLLEQGVVTVLASDGHNRQHRPPDLEPGRAAAALIIGDASSRRLVEDNPRRLAAEQFTLTP